MQKKAYIILAFIGSLSHAKDYSILESQETNWLYQKTESRLVKKALLLKNKIDKKNALDIKESKINASLFFDELSPEGRKAHIANTLTKMRDDLDKLKKIQTLMNAAKFDGIKYSPFKSSLNKLVGSVTIPGYLDDAYKIVESLREAKNFPENFGTNLKSGEQTAFKIAMIYMRPSENTISKMRMNYPAAVPPEVQIPNELMTMWFKKVNNDLVFQALNVGYVFGGEFQNKVCKGIDCSSFVSYVTESQTRLSTMVMEYTARDLGAGKPLTTETELKLKEEFWENWGMRQAKDEYRAFVPETTNDLKDGDIVVWRWIPPGKTAATGHAVLVVKVEDEDSFTALECNREDDKSLDGIILTKRLLKKDAADIYVLRRR